MRKPGKNHKDVFKLLESKMTPASIRRSDEKARELLLALRLAEFRRAMKVDQSSVKGFSQPAVSKIEARGELAGSGGAPSLLEGLSPSIRPRLMRGAPHQSLWVSRRGGPLQADAIYTLVGARTQEKFGKLMALHDFRRAAATFLDEF